MPYISNPVYYADIPMSELKHYGVPGMKWGVRKSRSVSGSSSRYRGTTSKSKPKSKPSPGYKTQYGHMSNDDLTKAIARLKLEKDYRDLVNAARQPSRAKAFFKNAASMLDYTSKVASNLASIKGSYDKLFPKKAEEKPDSPVQRMEKQMNAYSTRQKFEKMVADSRGDTGSSGKSSNGPSVSSSGGNSPKPKPTSPSSGGKALALPAPKGFHEQFASTYKGHKNIDTSSMFKTATQKVYDVEVLPKKTSYSRTAPKNKVIWDTVGEVVSKTSTSIVPKSYSFDRAQNVSSMLALSSGMQVRSLPPASGFLALPPGRG